MTRASIRSILVVDVGGTSVKCGMVVDRVPQAGERLFPSSLLRNADPVGSFAKLVKEFCAEAGLTPDLMVSTVPGFIDTDGDRVLFAGNVPELNGHHLASELGALLGFPVIIERDSVLVLAGEVIAGAAKGADSVLGLFFGTGVGGAFLQGGEAFRGGGWALEIGHMPFGNEGRTLEGLRTDCLETYVSGRALEVIAARHGVPVTEIFVQSRRIPELRADVDRFVRDQALAIGTAVALFSPATIVLGGGVCAIDAFPRRQLEELVALRAPFAETGRPMDLRWAGLGWRAVLYGGLKAADDYAAARSMPASKAKQERESLP
ncbi:ROK family protein [Mesorhizobium sp. BH1-1-5]|uniref:ROK family protein n=1 Tax=Mesorhizobium sp. BH1-1-5 TaxID=2876661 RepID=UPI001CCBCCD2|nr:ROK family protein [Mesorhizobium sp. BH1-1-5]MBZ9990207.1 ROK family protein [Mesorhizobium sp. BH1-1-5]